MKKFILGALLTAAMSVSVLAQDVYVAVNGEYIDFASQQPVIVEGRTLIPLRGVFEKLGYNVKWEADTKTAVLENGRRTIAVQANSDTLSVDNSPRSLDVGAQIINGSMMIPLRAISENLDLYVDWDAVSKTAFISDGKLAATNENAIPKKLGEDLKSISEKYQKIAEKYTSDEFKAAADKFSAAIENKVMPDDETMKMMRGAAQEFAPMFDELSDVLDSADALSEEYKSLFALFRPMLDSTGAYLKRVNEFCEGKITMDEMYDYHIQYSGDIEKMSSSFSGMFPGGITAGK